MTDTSGEAADRADLDAIRAHLAELPNALALAAQLNEGAIERSRLDLRTFHLVRAAALAASGAPPIAWQINLETMDDHVTADDVMGMLAAITPIIGTSRYVEAVTNIVDES
jgi:hypothetical protein